MNYHNLRKVLQTVMHYARGTALRYTVYSILTAILFPLNVVLIERCISLMEQSRERGYAQALLWLAFLTAGSLCAVWLEHGKRVSDVALSQELMRSCTPELIWKWNHIRYEYYEDARAADTISRMGSDPSGAIAGIFKKVIECAALFIRLFGTAVIYFRLSVLLGGILFVILGVQIVLGIRSQREVNQLYSIETPKERRLAYLGELLYGRDSVYDLKVNGSTGYLGKLQRKQAARILRDRIRINLRSEKYYMLSLLLMLLWLGALVGLLLAGLSAGTVGFALFATLLGAYPTLMGHLNTLSFYLSAMGGEFQTIQALSEFEGWEEENGKKSGGKAEKTAKSGAERESDRLAADPGGSEKDVPEEYVIEVSHVDFCYPGTDTIVLQDVSFTLRPSDTLAFAGANGSGKSTMIKLLCGLYRPTNGHILVNGVEMSEIDPLLRPRIISAVFQDYECYSLTMGENVGLGNIARIGEPDAIREALKQAGAEGLEAELPDGLDTNLNHLEENGVSLSGGQWQRLAIARAYMARGRYLLLDEPTASIDPVAESRMYREFVRILKGKGAVIVSHRLASAMFADRILVFEQGRIVESGSHEALLARGGLYCEMFRRQAAWYRDTAEGGEKA